MPSRLATNRVPACAQLEKRDAAKCRRMRARRLTVARYLAADSPNHRLAIWSPGCLGIGAGDHVVAVGRCAQPHLARHRRPDLRIHFTFSNPKNSRPKQQGAKKLVRSMFTRACIIISAS